MIDQSLLGAVIDKAATDAVCLALASAGKEPLFCDAQPGLKGFGEGKSWLHSEAERMLFGKTRPSWNQQRGTCVSQGTGRAMQDALYSAIASGKVIGEAVELCFETIYAGARIQIGKGQLGSGDGAVGAWAAQFIHDFGLLSRGRYGSIDLSVPREELACQWGAPRNGVPQMLLAESASYKAQSCMQCKSVEDVRDALAAKYGVARCANRATHGTRNQDGELRPVSCGGHCQELSGVYVDIRGDLRFCEQQSWNGNGPVGGGTFKLQDGREIEPREGECAIYPEDVQTYLKEGEIWAFAIPQTPWASSQKPSEIT